MKIGKRKLKMSSGEIRTFKSGGARNRFENYVNAIKHGWKPTGKKSTRKVHHSPTITYTDLGNPFGIKR